MDPLAERRGSYNPGRRYVTRGPPTALRRASFQASAFPAIFSTIACITLAFTSFTTQVAANGSGASDSDYADALNGAGGSDDYIFIRNRTAAINEAGLPPLLPPSGAWRGLNLGNLPIFPFRAAPLQQSEEQIKQLLRDAVSDLANAGGNLLRMWLHIDGATNPCWGRQPGGGDGAPEIVVGCNSEAVEDLKWLLRRCAARGVRVLLVLWSHDVLAVRRDNPPAHRSRALHLLRSPSATSAYLDACLTPLVTHLANTPLPTTDEEGWVGDVGSPSKGCSEAGGGGSGSSQHEAVATLPPSELFGAHSKAPATVLLSPVPAPAAKSPPPQQPAPSRIASNATRSQVSASFHASGSGSRNGVAVGASRNRSRNRSSRATGKAVTAGVHNSSRSSNSSNSSSSSNSSNSSNNSQGAALSQPTTSRSPRIIVNSGSATSPANAQQQTLLLDGRRRRLLKKDLNDDGCDAASSGGAPTYSSVLLGYEVLNEPEGMSWDLRLYHNYMYDIAWGPYQIEDPDWYDGQAERAGDHRTLQVLKTMGGVRRSSSGRECSFEGWHFVGGNRLPQSRTTGIDGGGLATDFYGCLSDGSVLASAAPDKFGNRSSEAASLRQRFSAAVDAASRAERGCNGGGGGAGAGGGAESRWYGKAGASAEWEGVAAAVAATPPAWGSGRGGGGGGMWFNRLMYQDVVGHANSELPYLLPLVSSCRLRTSDVSVPQLQRFVSRVAAAVHAADPRARVTVGAHSMPYCTDAAWLSGKVTAFEPWPRNLYSDAALRRAFTRRDGSIGPGWDPSGRGTLDFYAPHGYPAWGQDALTPSVSPFFTSASSFRLDKPVLIGEFWDKVTEGEALTAQRWSDLHSVGGYMGGLGWAMLQVAEAPVGGGGNGDGRQLAAPRRIVKHEKRDVYLRLLRQITASGGGGGGGGGSDSG